MEVDFNTIVGLHGHQYDGVTIKNGHYSYVYRMNHIAYWLRQLGRGGEEITEDVVVEFHNCNY